MKLHNNILNFMFALLKIFLRHFFILPSSNKTYQQQLKIVFL
jgi:hypothetical protein